MALALYSRVSKTAAGCIQVDIITDRYFNNGLKEGTQGAHGNEGTMFGDINDHDEVHIIHEIQLSQNDECEGVEVSTEKNNVLFHGQGAVHGRDNQK